MQDELTLKELILVIQDYAKYFTGKWYWFLIGGLLLGGVFFYRAYTTPREYIAPLTFMLNDEPKASLGAGAILGSLGLGNSEGGSTAKKLLELSKSRKILGEILFDSVNIGNQTQLLADHIIEIYDYHEDWEEKKSLKGFYFGESMPALDDVKGNKAFKILYNQLINKNDGLVELSVDDFSGVFSLKASTLDAELSITLVNSIYEELLNYFVSTAISDKESTLKQLEARADSVKTELKTAEARLARFQDRSSGFLLRENTTRGQDLNRQLLILSTMYAEILKNKETAAFLLANEKPAFNLIDFPLNPLSTKKESLSQALGLGSVVGMVLVGIILFFTKLVGDAMRA